MGFEFRRSVDVLPFLRLNKTRKTTKPGGSGEDRGRSWTWHVGPWRYDTRTGRHTFKLGRTVAYKTKPRGKVAAARVAKVRARHPDWTAAQVAERAGVTRATARRCIRRADRKRDRAAWDAAWQRHLYGDTGTPTGQAATRKATSRKPPAPRGSGTPAATAAGTGQGSGGTGAGLCGQTTADGTPCQRRGTCPPGTHARGGTRAKATP